MKEQDKPESKKTSTRYNIKEFIEIGGAIASISGITVLLIGKEIFSNVFITLLVVLPIISLSFFITGTLYSYAKDHYIEKYSDKSNFKKLLFISSMIFAIPLGFFLIIVIIIQLFVWIV